MTSLSFLKDFKKKVEKLESVSVGLTETSRWYSTGNYALNRVFTGNYFRGIPESRLVLLAGPSSSGKSFLSGNFLKQAQDDGAFIMVLDTENAIDAEYLGKLGVSFDEDKFLKLDIGIIEDVNKTMSDFFKGYIAEYGSGKSGRPIMIVLDSLAMLSTSTEFENFDKGGEVKGDQGQRAKRTKAMLRMICSRVAQLPITMILTDHVYPADVMLGQGKWAITNSTRFAMSIIGVVEALKLKEDTNVVGVRMRVEGYKTRFTQVGKKCELEIPYNKRMSRTTGMFELLEADEVLTKVHGGWSFINAAGETKKIKENMFDNDENQDLLFEILTQANAKIAARADANGDVIEKIDDEDREGFTEAVEATV